MVKQKLHIVWLLVLIFSFSLSAQDYLREVVSVPKVDSGAIKIDGLMNEAEWANAAKADMITNTGYNIWANKYYRESLAEPEFDELYARMLWNKDSLYVFVRIDEFVNDSTGLFFPGQWQGDQLFISLSNRLGVDMMGWYDGNVYAAPDGPYHFLIVGEDVTLNMGNETYIPDEYQKFEGDTVRIFNANDISRSAVTLNYETGVMTVEMAIYNPHIINQSSIAFNIGGSNGSQAAFDVYEDAYQYYTWQPHVPNDPWADPYGNGDPGFFNLANADYWAMLKFQPTITSVEQDDNNEIFVSDYQLLQNYPNPFNPTTNIKFSLPKASQVSLKVYNILGQLVANLIDNQEIEYGVHSIKWNASSLSSGVYIYELRTENFIQSKKMLLIK